MQNEAMIPAHDCCIHYNIEYSFLTSLQQHGLLEITTIEQTGFISLHELQKLERLIRLHNDLDINLEGIETVTYLLQKVETMQSELNSLRHRLRFYEVQQDYKFGL